MAPKTTEQSVRTTQCSALEGDTDEQPQVPARGAGGLPWGLVAIAAVTFFLVSNRQAFASDGAFIYVIGAVILGVMSANLLTRK